MDDAPLTPSCSCFRSAPEAGQMFITPAHHDILAMVRAWRIGDRPVLVMTGDSGTGKTTFARKLAATFGATMQVGLLDAEKMKSADLRQQVPAAFGSAVQFSGDDPLTSHAQFIAECLVTGRRRLLIVDEAQHLSQAALDYLQQLTTPPRSGLPVFYVVLIGGPDLDALLARPDHQVLRDRIGGQLQLSPFTESQTAAYVDHRLRVSNCQCAVGGLTFDTARLALLHEASGGRPKIIDRLVQRVLFDPVRAGTAAKIARPDPPVLPAAPVDDKTKPLPPVAPPHGPTPLPPPVAVARGKAAAHPVPDKVRPLPVPPPGGRSKPAPLHPAKVDPAQAPFQRPATWGTAVPLASVATKDPSARSRPSASRPSVVRDKPAPKQPSPPRQEARSVPPSQPAVMPVTLVPRSARVASPAPASAARPGPSRAAASAVTPGQDRADGPAPAARRAMPWGLAGAAGLGLAAVAMIFLGQGEDQLAERQMAAPAPPPVAAPMSEPAPPAPTPEAAPAPDPVAIETAPKLDLPPAAPGLRGATVAPEPDADALLAEALAAGATNPTQAAQLYTRAALWGNARAAYYLGQLHETGIGVPQNPDRARAAYALALEVDGAAARLEALEGRLTPGTSVAAAPVPVSQMAFTTAATELHWRDAEGAVASRFRVEFVPAGGGEDIQQIETVLPALLLPHGLARWRVIALDANGTAGAASEWSVPNPALP